MKRILGMVAAIVSGLLVAYFALIVVVGNSTLDIQLHDTYFAIDMKSQVIPLIFLLLVLIVLLTWAFAARFGKMVVNILLLIVIACFILWLTLLSGTFTNLTTSVKFASADQSGGYGIQSDPWNAMSLAVVLLQGSLLVLFVMVSFKFALTYTRNKL